MAIRSITAFLALAVASTALAGATASPSRGAQIGVNIDPNPVAVSDALNARAQWVRAFVWWSTIEPTRGVLDEPALERYRETAAALHARGVHVVWVVVGSPGWASLSGSLGGPPDDPAAYARFVAGVARRMGPAVDAYEIWNEEDLTLFWGGRPDPARYVRLLSAAYLAIKAVAPNAIVMFGGLAGNDYEYLERAYRAGARGLFDAVGVHTDIPCELRRPGRFVRAPNGRISRWSFLGYREVHRTMLAHRDRKPLYMTELGWAVSDEPCLNGVWAHQKPAGISETKQASNLADAFACLSNDRYVRAGLWFLLNDPGIAGDGATGYGLRRPDKSPRPALAVFRAAAAGRTVGGSCADHYVGPRVRLSAFRDRRTAALVIHAHIASDLVLARATVTVDRRRVRTLLKPARDLHVRVEERTVGGRHVVTVGALDVAHNAGRATRVVAAVR